MNNLDELSKIIVECKIEKCTHLEEIMDETLEDVIAQHDFKEYKEMSPSETNEIMRELLNTKKEVLTNRSVSMDSEGKILKVAERNNEGIKNIETKYNKTTFALFATFFLLGTLIGLQDEFWKPYLSDIINGAKAFATWGR